MHFPWFAWFDMEAMLQKMEESHGEKLTLNQNHQPISANVCSNVDGYEKEHFIFEENPETLGEISQLP